jgi:hypothetical protein
VRLLSSGPRRDIEVVFADSDQPIPLADQLILLPSSLVGMRCAAAIRLLLDNDLIETDQLGASSHLVIHHERSRGDDDDGTIDVPDCIIWCIDTGSAFLQLVCDAAENPLVVAQETAMGPEASTLPKNYVGWRCVDALADLGG